MHFNCTEEALKLYIEDSLIYCIFDYAKVELLQIYFRYTLNILRLKTDII